MGTSIIMGSILFVLGTVKKKKKSSNNLYPVMMSIFSSFLYYKLFSTNCGENGWFVTVWLPKINEKSWEYV